MANDHTYYKKRPDEGDKPFGAYFTRRQPNFYDVILSVEERNFYVMKGHLAQHSEYFNTMFFKRYEERTKKLICLHEVDAEGFQLFMELINGHLCLTDKNVEGALHVCRMLLASIATKRCEDFLIRRSRLPIEKKFELGVEYMLNNLKNKILADVPNVAGLASIMPANIQDLDPVSQALALQKFTDMLRRNEPPPAPPPPPRPRPVVDDAPHRIAPGPNGERPPFLPPNADVRLDLPDQFDRGVFD